MTPDPHATPDRAAVKMGDGYGSPSGSRPMLEAPAAANRPHATDRAATVEQIITKRLGAWYRADYQPTEMDAKVAGDIAARLAHAGLTEIDRGHDD